MIRSLYKGPYIDNKLLKDAIDAKINNKKVLYTRSRSSTITFDFLDLTVFVYNGKIYYPLIVKEYMLGYKFGAFCFTKKRAVFNNKKKKIIISK